jgi:hypothetical protein
MVAKTLPQTAATARAAVTALQPILRAIGEPIVNLTKIIDKIKEDIKNADDALKKKTAPTAHYLTTTTAAPQNFVEVKKIADLTAELKTREEQVV